MPRHEFSGAASKPPKYIDHIDWPFYSDNRAQYSRMQTRSVPGMRWIGPERYRRPFVSKYCANIVAPAATGSFEAPDNSNTFRISLKSFVS